MIYTEAVSVLYEGNIFDIDHLDTLFYLRRSVLPRRMNQIRSLNFVWYFRTRPDTAAPPFDLNTWNEACEVVAGLSGLQDLRVHLDGHGGIQAGANWKHEWGPVLDPLMRIKPARKFDVFLPWSEEDCEEAVKGCGYQFRLCPSSSRSRDS